MCDNGRFHRTAAVFEWLAAHRDQITVYWLPAYSPSLNLIERLWGHVKRTVLANVLYNSLDDLVAAFRHGVRHLTGNRQRMGFMFNHDDLTQEIQRNCTTPGSLKHSTGLLSPRPPGDQRCWVLTYKQHKNHS